MSPLVFWPSALGLTVFAAGLWSYRSDLFAPAARGASRVRSLAPVFIATALATFSGEHFTVARDFSRMVPKWLPQPLFITYVVGVALLAAALSFVARRCMRWSAPLLALLFALFVLTLYLPSAFRHPGIRIVWIFPFREGSFALGAFSVFVYESWKRPSPRFALFARLWTAWVAIFFGLQNILYPQFAPGVPDQQPTSAWVPLPLYLAYLIGGILIALGIATLFKRATVAAVTAVGILMAVLAIGLFAPDLFLAHDVAQRITAINFVADTLLFSGTMFAVARAIETTTTP
jgi:uncharacterized membrane protein